MMTPIPWRLPTSLVAAAVTIALAGCAGTPRQDGPLEAARSVVAAAHNDPAVTGDAQSDLARADGALATADALMATGKPLPDVEHQAYLADRYARTAREHGKLLASGASIAQLDNRRNAVLIGAREADARRATDLAATKTAEAADAVANAAASARATASETDRADRLDAQLTELQGKHTDRGVVVTLGDVLFETGSSTLQATSQRSIGKLAEFLGAHPERTTRIEGFTDSVGSDASNRALADRRASAVADALTRSGVARSRIQAEGYGNAYPVADNASVAGRQQNRRVEVVISDDDRRIADRRQ